MVTFDPQFASFLLRNLRWLNSGNQNFTLPSKATKSYIVPSPLGVVSLLNSICGGSVSHLLIVSLIKQLHPGTETSGARLSPQLPMHEDNRRCEKRMMYILRWKCAREEAYGKKLYGIKRPTLRGRPSVVYINWERFLTAFPSAEKPPQIAYY